MKFGKRYTEYVEKESLRLQGCSYVKFKRHKKLFKRCCRQERLDQPIKELPSCSNNCLSSCSVCDGMFFPNLLGAVSSVVGYFNNRAQQLVQFHLSSKFQRFMLRIKNNFAAIQKILKKYDKVHRSVAGRTFRTRLQAMRVELLQSPFLIELTALYINLKASHKEGDNHDVTIPEECSCEFGDKPTLKCRLIDSQIVEIDLTCSICLETAFEPVALGCGHLFCNSCACSAAFVPTIHGFKVVRKDAKCPLCRQAGVYSHAVLLTELNRLIQNYCEDYWEERQQKERVERVLQFKQHYENQMKVVLGVS